MGPFTESGLASGLAKPSSGLYSHSSNRLSCNSGQNDRMLRSGNGNGPCKGQDSPLSIVGYAEAEGSPGNCRIFCFSWISRRGRLSKVSEDIYKVRIDKNSRTKTMEKTVKKQTTTMAKLTSLLEAKQSLDGFANKQAPWLIVARARAVRRYMT